MELSQSDLKTLGRWRRSTFLVVIFGYIGYYLVRQNLPAAFPLMQQAMHFSNSQLGLIAASSEIVYAIGKFLNGPLADQLGAKKIFLIGLAGGIVCNLAFAFGSSLLWFMVVWCLCRYFLSMGWGGVAKTIGAWYAPEKHGTVMGWVTLSFQFGGVLATLFAAWLVSLGQSWDKLFIYPALLSTALWLWACFGLKQAPGDVIPGADLGHSRHIPLADFGSGEKPGTGAIIRTLLGLRIFRYLLVFGFFATFLRSIFAFWMPKFLVDIGMGQASAIFNSALLPFLGCIGTILLGWYTDTYARRNRARPMWIMLVGLFFSLVGIALLAEGGPGFHLPIVILLGLSGFFLAGPDSMVVGALTLDIAGTRAAGTCSGFIDGIGYLGGALATWGAGRLSDSLGWSQVFWALAACALLSVAAAMLMSREFVAQQAGPVVSGG
ncbi:MAG TPA: MFS transporter [Candidatus Obscuribacterales bacterium]